MLLYQPGDHERAARSVQLRATTFDNKWFRHLPYMIKWGSPFVVVFLVYVCLCTEVRVGNCVKWLSAVSATGMENA